MKITIYELLELVKDGKAPKKIKTDIGIFKLEIEDDQLHYRCNDGGILIFDYYIENNKLNNEVEIIEEPKKIEYEQIEELSCNDYDFEKKTINSLIKNQRKLIDEINNLKEK